jgi:hypothetical protein
MHDRGMRMDGHDNRRDLPGDVVAAAAVWKREIDNDTSSTRKAHYEEDPLLRIARRWRHG